MSSLVVPVTTRNFQVPVPVDKIQGLDEDEKFDDVVRLISKQGDCFEITSKQAKLSVFVSEAMEADRTVNEVTVNEVGTRDLAVIVEYLKHHDGNPSSAIRKPLKSPNPYDFTNEWDAQFVLSIPFAQLQAISCAANFMNIKSLVELCCARFAGFLLKRSTQELFEEIEKSESAMKN